MVKMKKLMKRARKTMNNDKNNQDIEDDTRDTGGSTQELEATILLGNRLTFTNWLVGRIPEEDYMKYISEWKTIYNYTSTGGSDNE